MDTKPWINQSEVHNNSNQKNRAMFIVTGLLIVLSFPGWTLAQTVTGYSGVFEHGNSVIISGSSFGTKATAAPAKWDNFEDGVVGEIVSSTGYWSIDAGGGRDPIFSVDHARTPGSVNANVELSYWGGQDIMYRNEVLPGDYKYLSFWTYWQSPSNDNSEPWQHKMWGLAQHYPSTVYPALSYHIWDSTWAYLDPYGTNTTHSTLNTHMPTNNAWNFIQVEIYEGTVGNSDATIKYMMNGVTQFDATTDVNLKVSAGDVMDSFKVGWFLGNMAPEEWAPGMGVEDEIFDDIYIDTSWARVELGNSADYESCTHREMQIPSEWSSTSITISANMGSFSGLDDLYLFVTDNEGNVSIGYQVNGEFIGPGQPGKPVAVNE